MTCRGRSAFLWLQGGMHRVCSFMLLARLQDICRDLQNCTYSLVTRTACGMLLSLCLHAERFFILCTGDLLRLLFIMLFRYASMHRARLVVCLFYYLCVGCVLCLLKRSLRRTPLCQNNHGNCPENALFVCLCCLYLPYPYFFTSISSCEDFNVFFFLPFAL